VAVIATTQEWSGSEVWSSFEGSCRRGNAAASQLSYVELRREMINRLLLSFSCNSCSDVFAQKPRFPKTCASWSYVELRSS
jgi:hypothetical protein